MEKGSKILVTGCQGMTGWAIVRELQKQGYFNIVCIDRTDCNLLDQKKVLCLFEKESPEYVFHVAAKVGGMYANNAQSGAFIYENLVMQCNVIESARICKVEKLLFCGSACSYPKEAIQPTKEEELLSGPLEETNIGYAIAKIAGVTMCQMYNKQYGCNFISVMPANMYGIGDNFSLSTGHVIPGLISKFYEAKTNKSTSIKIMGTGEASREFVFVDDVAKGLIFLMNNYNDSNIINIGTGVSIKIKYLVDILKNEIGYDGEIIYSGGLEGVKERCLDCTKINTLGWKYETDLKEGIRKVYDWYVDNFIFLRK